MNIQWDLIGAAPDVGNLFRKGMAEGRETTRGYQQDNALAALAQSPDDPQALQQLAGINPDAAWKIQDRRIAGQDRITAAKKAEQALIKQQLDQRKEDILEAAKIIRQEPPTDDASWQRVLSSAKLRGINLDGVPTTFDATYVQQLVTLADTFDPDEIEMKTTEQGGGAFTRNKRTGETKVIIAPNDGTQPMGAPAGGLTDEEIAKMYGGQASTTPGTFPGY